MGIYVTNELDILTAQPIIDRLMKTIDELQIPIFTNYMQHYIIEGPDDVTFTLEHTPLDDSVYVMVNGIAYYNDGTRNYFTCEEIDGVYVLTWDSSQLLLEEGFRFTIVYNYRIVLN